MRPRALLGVTAVTEVAGGRGADNPGRTEDGAGRVLAEGRHEGQGPRHIVVIPGT